MTDISYIEPFNSFFTEFGIFGVIVLYLIIGGIIQTVLPLQLIKRGFLWRYFEKLSIFLNKKLNRKKRSDTDRFVRGTLVVATLFLVSYGLDKLIDIFVYAFPEGWYIFLFVIAGAVSHIAPLRLSKYLIKLDKKTQPDKYNKALKRVEKWNDLSLEKSDIHAVRRHLVEWLAKNLCDCVIGPIIWFALLGSFGVFLYVSMMSIYCVLEKTGNSEGYFGHPVSGMNVVFGFVPSVITAFIICLSAVFVPKSTPLLGLRMMIKQMKTYKNINDAIVLSAISGCLNCTLLGSKQYKTLKKNQWIGPKGATAKLEIGHIRVATYLYMVSVAILFLALLGLFWLVCCF